MERAQANFFADQIAGRIDPGIFIDPHLRQAKQAPRKDGNRGKRHAATFGNQVGRQRKLANIELALLQHSLVPVLSMLERIGLTDFQNIQINSFHLHRAIEKRYVTVIVRQCHRKARLSHIDYLEWIFSLAYFILIRLSTLKVRQVSRTNRLEDRARAK